MWRACTPAGCAHDAASRVRLPPIGGTQNGPSAKARDRTPTDRASCGQPTNARVVFRDGRRRRGTDAVGDALLEQGRP
jgi:hypothetical protein